jgi:hypothetical protein
MRPVNGEHFTSPDTTLFDSLEFIHFTVLMYKTASLEQEVIFHTIVTSDEGICISVLVLSIYVFLSLFHGNIHVAIKASQDT